MATYQDFKNLTAELGLEDDCPVCGYSWPGCQEMCVAHEAMNGQMGPYHQDYCDNCPQCDREAKLAEKSL